MILIQCYIVVSILSLPVAMATWFCDCEPRLEDPPDMGRLRQAMAVDPIAEWKYHFDCADIRDPGPDHTHTPAVDSSSGSALRPCEPLPDEYSLVAGVNGFNVIEYGFNIVKDSDHRSTQAPTLDVHSTHRYNATILDPLTNRCFAVPDAFLTTGPQPTVAITFNHFASQGFRVVAAASGREQFRRKMIQSRKIEFELDGGEFETSGLKAAFLRTRLAADFETQDWANLEYMETTHQVFIQRPMPTEEVIRKWAELSKLTNDNKMDDKFRYYFEGFGTHYVASASLGFVFYLGSSMKKPPEPYDVQKTANCIATKVSEGLGLKVVGTSCKEADAKTVANTDVLGLVRMVLSYGDGSNSFREIRENFKKGRGLAMTQKRWVTQLIDHVVKGASGGDEVYKEIVAQFGETGDFEQDLKRLQEFRGLVAKQLVKYLESIDPCGEQDC